MLLKQFVQGHGTYGPNSYNKDYTGQSNVNAFNFFACTTNSMSYEVKARQGSTNTSFWYVSVGKGDTEPTYDDYQLADLITDLTYVSGSGQGSYNSRIIRSVTAVFRNDTANPITVKEIGLGFQTNTGNNGFLAARSVLETPVTIGAGETYAFTYNIEV